MKENKLFIYCLSLNNELLNKIKKLNYIPVGLGKEKFSRSWLRDNTGDNISEKNNFYGEYSFHYWLWKNEIQNIPDDTWIGFCTYRRFWKSEKNISENNSKFYDKILQKIPNEWEDFDTILGDHIQLKFKKMKILKYGKLALLKNPKALYSKKYRNIKFHFDIFHGVGILDKAIDLLEETDRDDFRYYVNNNDTFNKTNMFICKSKKIISRYYETIFKWLEKCEKIIGFNLEGYNKVRMYGFLAERFMPYWFYKNSKVMEWPIIFDDLNEKKDIK